MIFNKYTNQIPYGKSNTKFLQKKNHFFRSYDEKDVKSGGKLHQMFMDFMGLGDNYQINHYRMLKFGGIMYEQPSQLGLPLAYMDSTTISGHFKANIKRQNNFKMQQGQFNFRRYVKTHYFLKSKQKLKGSYKLLNFVILQNLTCALGSQFILCGFYSSF